MAQLGKEPRAEAPTDSQLPAVTVPKTACGEHISTSRTIKDGAITTATVPAGARRPVMTVPKAESVERIRNDANTIEYGAVEHGTVTIAELYT